MQQYTGIDLQPILTEPVDWRSKSWPVTSDPVMIKDVKSQGWNALSGEFSLPVLVLKEAALEHNIQLMSTYAKEHGVSLAPHTKTPASPQLADRQLAAGAWAISVATFHHARLFRQLGFRRILMANQLLEPRCLAWVAEQLASDPDFQFWCLVDSSRAVELMESHLASARYHGRLGVLVELGIAGGRSGCRSVTAGVELAEQVAQSPYLRLAGIEAYENVAPLEEFESKLAAVDQLMGEMRHLANSLADGHLLPAEGELLITAGGSMFFDRVVNQLAADWHLPLRVRLVLRCGSYIAHDEGAYEAYSPLAGRSEREHRLRQALELWSLVLSRPEPGLAVLGVR